MFAICYKLRSADLPVRMSKLFRYVFYMCPVVFISGTLVTIALYVLQDPVAETTLVLGPRARYGVELIWQQLAVTSSLTLWRGQWLWFELIFERDLATMWLATLAAGLFVTFT